MTEPTQIRAYLLGTLEPEAAHALDTRLFLDEEFYASVCEQRDLLTDDFLAGSLSAGEDARFRKQCRLSPDLREAVQSSRTLQQALERSRPSPPRTVKPLKPSPSWRLFGLPLFAGALCALLLTVQIARHRPASSPEAAPPLAPPQSANVSAPPQPEPETFFLAAAVTRGATHDPTIQVPPETTKIKLEVEIRHDLENIPSWSTELIGRGHTAPLPGCEKPQHLGGQIFLSCPLELETLPDGPYLIRMTPSQTNAPSVDREFLLARKPQPRKP